MDRQLPNTEALRVIKPSALLQFAAAHGWRCTGPYGDNAGVFNADAHPEIVIPKTSSLVDYPAVVSRLIGIFSAATNQDEASVYRALMDSESGAKPVPSAPSRPEALQAPAACCVNRHTKTKTPSEPRNFKFQMMFSASEIEAIDSWMFENRIRSRASAIRRLCAERLTQIRREKQGN